MSAFAKFYFRPQKGEKIHTVVVPKEEESSGIFGKVIDESGVAVTDALVALFEAEGKGELIASAFSDEEGEFSFGPLESGKLYFVRVTVNSLMIRELEISL